MGTVLFKSELTQRRKDAKIQREYKKSFLGELGGFARESFLHAGVGAKAAVFSFNGNKIITTSGGGMLASDDKEFIERARFLSQQAREDFPHYEHTEIGYNYRMSNVLAAIGRGQLRVLDERVKKKREIFDYYRAALGDVPGIEFMPEPEWSRSNRWLTVILVTPEEFGAGPSTIFRSYPSTIFRSYGAGADYTDYKDKKACPCRVVGGSVAEDLFERGLCLPSGTQMTEGDLDRVVDVIREAGNW